MSNDIIERARRDAVRHSNEKKKKQKVAKKRKKMVNYVVLLLLIASVLANIALIKKSNFSNPKSFNEITYGEDYDKEFEDVNSLIESYISSCISSKISKDKRRIKDENGIDTGKYYYNFTNYDNVFSNLDVLINNYQMNSNDTKEFSNFINNLSKEEKEAILIYYGTSYIEYDNNKESFKSHVGTEITKNNVSDNAIEALAESAVRKLTSNFLDSKWINNSLERSK